MASRLAAAKSTESHDVGANAPAGRTLDPITPCPSSLSMGPLRRSNPRQEPSAVVPHARICAGGDPNLTVKGRPYRDPPEAVSNTETKPLELPTPADLQPAAVRRAGDAEDLSGQAELGGGCRRRLRSAATQVGARGRAAAARAAA